MDEPKRLKINVANADSPGYLYRMRQVAGLKAKLNAKNLLLDEKVNLMAQMILPFVTEPQNPEEALNLLTGPNGPSENEFKQMLDAITGSISDPLSPTSRQENNTP